MAFGEGLHTSGQHNKRRMQLYAVGGLAALAVVFLIMRRSSASSTTGGYTAADLQNAASQQAAADQAAAGGGAFGTPSTFADNGGSAASLADSVTQALGGVQTSLDNLTAAQQALSTNGSLNPVAAGDIPGTTPDPSTVASAVAAPAAAKQGFHPQRPKGAPAGAKWTGSRKPGPGWKGIGGGWWKPPTPPRVPPQRRTTVKGSHGTSSHHTSGTKTHNHAKRKK